MRSPGLTNEQAVRIIVVIRRAAVLLLYSLSVRAVFVRCGNAALYYGSKLAPVLPSKGVSVSIVVRKRISYRVIGDVSSVERGKAVKPR